MTEENTAAWMLLNWMWTGQRGWARLVLPAPIDLCPVARDAEPLGESRYFRWPDQAAELLAEGAAGPETRFDPELCVTPPPDSDWAGARDLLPEDFDPAVFGYDLPAPEWEPDHVPSVVVWVEADRLNADQWRLVKELDAVVTAPERGDPFQVWARAERWAQVDTSALATDWHDLDALVIEEPPYMWWPARVLHGFS
ncbi:MULTISPECIES: hypothetical protein [unclassified Nocardiopsis]|uniref:hypothetical protein n=1 Tax=Nocardiopsis TaxID=2013 RepID=UPI00387B9750